MGWRNAGNPTSAAGLWRGHRGCSLTPQSCPSCWHCPRGWLAHAPSYRKVGDRNKKGGIGGEGKKTPETWVKHLYCRAALLCELWAEPPLSDCFRDTQPSKRLGQTAPDRPRRLQSVPPPGCPANPSTCPVSALLPLPQPSALGPEATEFH